MDIDPSSLVLSLIVSSIGFVLFSFGRKMDRFPQLVAGLALMVFPYFVTSLVAMVLIAVGILVALWAFLNFA